MKGKLEEVISYAKHADDISFYSVVFRDFDKLKEITLSEFLAFSDPPIPRHRIHLVRRYKQSGYTPLPHEVKYCTYGGCPRCGMILAPVMASVHDEECGISEYAYQDEQ